MNKESDPRIKHQAERIFQPDTVEAKAFSTLDLAPPVTVDEVKARYKKMARRHHPDANEGSKKSEELFKQIVQAYQVILKYLES